jgi:TetR/AcrR family transcriptional regulator, transcriptional repressor for nem operon
VTNSETSERPSGPERPPERPPERTRGNAGRRPGKRERLIEAARGVLYEHGVEKSALADIAAAADVPLGNVYYYFKTKDALVSAVIDRYRQTFGEMSAQLSLEDEPVGRLKALLAALTARQERLASYGCPIGTLTSELGKRDDDLGAGAGAILSGVIDWAETQFQEMGREDARELATALIAAYEGIVLLAAALRDASLIGTEVSRLSRWIDSLAELQPASPAAAGHAEA